MKPKIAKQIIKADFYGAKSGLSGLMYMVFRAILMVP
jgi:hypothetical protein